MWPFGELNDQSNDDIEATLDRLANSDLRLKASVRSVAAQTPKQTAPGRPEQQHGQEVGSAAKPKPKKKAKKRSQMGAAEVFGGVELVEYTRADGTPGIVIRRKGGRRGVAWRLRRAIGPPSASSPTPSARARRWTRSAGR